MSVHFQQIGSLIEGSLDAVGNPSEIQSALPEIHLSGHVCSAGELGGLAAVQIPPHTLVIVL